MEPMDAEQRAELERTLRISDEIKHPLHELQQRVKVTQSATKDTPVPKPQKERYVPPWWRGDDVNAKIALKVMETLP